MAFRYWVGGSGTWDNSSTANWATTSGGASGASAPTNADDVIFDLNSGTAATVTVAATAVSLNTTVNKSDINLSLSGAPTLCTAAGVLTFTQGTITLNDNDLTVGRIASTNSNIRTIAFGSGNIILSSTTAAAVILSMATATNFTWTGTGGFSRNQAATATVQFGTLAGGSSTNAPNLSVTAGASALTITSGSYFKNLIFTGSTCTVTTATVNISGNLTLATGGTYTSVSPTFIGTSTVTSSGKTMSSVTVTGSGITVTLADALTLSGTLSVTQGTFDTADYNVSAVALSSSGTLTRTVDLGSSTVSLSRASPTSPITLSGSNLTWTPGTSQINLTNNAPSLINNATYNNYYNLSFTSTTAGAGDRSISNAGSYNNLTFSAPSTAAALRYYIDAPQTVSGTFTCAGASALRRVFVFGITNSAVAITAATLAGNDCDFLDITISGGAAGTAPTRAGNCGNNSGITFPAAKNVWRVSSENGWAGVNSWATGSGGTGSDDNFPLPQDTAKIDNGATPSGTLTISGFNKSSIDFSDRTNAITASFDGDFYGSITLSSSVTVTGTSVNLLGRGTNSITSAGQTFAISVSITLALATGTILLGDAFTGSASCGLTHNSGTFNANGYNFTIGRFVSSTTLSRTITMGSGTWTLSGTGTVWNTSTITNLTFNKDTANIVLSDTTTTARTFNGGGRTFNDLTIGGATGTSVLTIVGGNTFGTISSTKTVAHTIRLTAGTTTTVSNWTVAGTAGNLVTLDSTTAGVRATLSKSSGTVTAAYHSIKDNAATGGATWIATNSINGGNNTGWIFQVASGNFLALFF